MVYIGGASINEYGTGEGGKPGDQNGEECYIQPWYLHRKGWTVIRAKSQQMREKIAQDMRYLCENDNIGYSYWEHCYSLYNEVKRFGFNCSKVTTPCETNCAKAVWICALYAGAHVGDFSTADEVQKFRETGEFEIITDPTVCNSSDKLLEGDILVTNSKGHTVVVMNNGEDMDAYKWFANTETIGTYKATSDAHLRRFPDTGSKSIKVISKDGSVFSDGIGCNRIDSNRVWVHVFYGNDEGFVSTKLLEKVK